MPPSQARTEDGRVAQKRRTRQAIIAATQGLLADGHTPSIEQITAAADVSRRTVYMYFATLDQLLIDATSGLLSNRTVEPMLESPDFGSDPLERVDKYAVALLDLAPSALPNARRLLRLTVDSELPHGSERRGYRRMEWISRVLQPLREQLDDEQFERLASALAIVLGWEAMIVLRDSRGLGPADEQRVIRWAARALVTAMVDESTRAADAT